MIGDLRLELPFADLPLGKIKVTRYGYRKAMTVDRFLTIHGRCGEKVGQEVRQFQEELDSLAGHVGAPDNHCTYEVYKADLGLLFVVTFHDDYVYFGKSIRKGDW